MVAGSKPTPKKAAKKLEAALAKKAPKRGAATEVGDGDDGSIAQLLSMLAKLNEGASGRDAISALFDQT